jgi:uncharacterized protein YhaN
MLRACGGRNACFWHVPRGGCSLQVLALERTLDQMIESNTAFNKSFKPVNEKRAFEERAKLRERLDRVYDNLKFKRAGERALAGDVAQAEARQAQLAVEEAGLAAVVRELEARREEAAAAVQARAVGDSRRCASEPSDPAQLKCLCSRCM